MFLESVWGWVAPIVGVEPDKRDVGAGDGTRTRDVQLGKLAFYH